MTSVALMMTMKVLELLKNMVEKYLIYITEKQSVTEVLGFSYWCHLFNKCNG
jgi:hypothetical protein